MEKCVNSALLNQHMEEIEKDEKYFEAMKEELSEQFEDETFDLREKFNKAVAKYGFEYSFVDFIGDM